MKSLKGTKTEVNLMAAFSGESQARNRYTFFASVAKKEGYEQISAIFLETAENEKEHAKRFYKFLGETEVKVCDVYGSHYGDTATNLEHAANGEHHEWAEIYAKGEAEAREEGFEEIAVVFKKIGEVEKHHEARYRKLLENLKQDKVFKREEEVEWKCRNCGFVFKGKAAPEKCPACAHPKAYFELNCDNY